jgi:hypothetical protein
MFNLVFFKQVYLGTLIMTFNMAPPKLYAASTIWARRTIRASQRNRGAGARPFLD